jgi:hypothetical protein
VLAEVNNVSSEEAVEIFAFIFVLVCLIAALVAGFRQLWIACACCVGVALIAGILLL